MRAKGRIKKLSIERLYYHQALTEFNFHAVSVLADRHEPLSVQLNQQWL